MPADPVVAALPGDALVLLVGPSGAGKSTWAAQRFDPAEVLSSDDFREWIAGDAADQSVNAAAFGALHRVAHDRLQQGLRTVVDATNLSISARRSLRRLASGAGRPTVAVAFDVSLRRCLAQNAARPGRSVPPAVVRRQHRALRPALALLPFEGFLAVHVIGEQDMPAA
jgi:protein phosphatase